VVNSRRSGRDAPEKRLGLIYAFAREEDVDAIGLYPIDCADGSYQVVAQIALRSLLGLATDL
jgi:hypothetical protein